MLWEVGIGCQKGGSCWGMEGRADELEREKDRRWLKMFCDRWVQDWAWKDWHGNLDEDYSCCCPALGGSERPWPLLTKTSRYPRVPPACHVLLLRLGAVGEISGTILPEVLFLALVL